MVLMKYYNDIVIFGNIALQLVGSVFIELQMCYRMNRTPSTSKMMTIQISTPHIQVNLYHPRHQ